MRLVVLRQINLDKLVVKEPYSPCVLLIRPSEPLTDAQLRRLVTATPWNPVAMDATIGAWDSREGVFETEIHSIELMPKIPQPLKSRRRSDARKQHASLLHM